MIKYILLFLSSYTLCAQTSINVFNTVTNMVSSPVPNSLNIFCYSLGRTSINDGGGGGFFWKAGDATATNNDSVFASTYSGGATGRFLRISLTMASTGVGVTNIGNVISANLSASTNITFTTNANGQVGILVPASGATSQIQYNNAGAFNADPVFRFDSTTKSLELGGTNGNSSVRFYAEKSINGIFDALFGSNSITAGNTSAGTQLRLGVNSGEGSIVMHPNDHTTIGKRNRLFLNAPNGVIVDEGATARLYLGTGDTAIGDSLTAVGGTLKVNTTTTGNVGAGEDNLITYVVTGTTNNPTLRNNGDYLEFDVFGTFAATANTARLKIHFGATVFLDTTSLVFNNLAWRGHGKIIRTGVATQKITCEFTVGGTLLSAVNGTVTTYVTAAETLTGNVTFKVTGEDTGGVPADNKVVQEGMIIKWYPNN